MTILTEILRLYTTGAKTADEVNAMLKEKGFNDIFLDPDKNKLTDEEIAETIVSDIPEEVSGYGMLDTGTGSLDKVKIENGVLINCDCGESYALVIIKDKMFEVAGTKLVPYGTTKKEA